jgi:hypothetical protein
VAAGGFYDSLRSLAAWMPDKRGHDVFGKGEHEGKAPERPRPSFQRDCCAPKLIG